MISLLFCESIELPDESILGIVAIYDITNTISGFARNDRTYRGIISTALLCKVKGGTLQ